MLHGNSNQNDSPHHLYAIDDLQKDEVWKYGISNNPIEADGLSKRVREQRDYLNLVVGWIRFAARILRTNIPNKEAARIIEDEYMDQFEDEHGYLPKGNKRRNRKR